MKHVIPNVDDPDFEDKALRVALGLMVELMIGPYTDDDRANLFIEAQPGSWGRHFVCETSRRDGTFNVIAVVWGWGRATRYAREYATRWRLQYGSRPSVPATVDGTVEYTRAA